MTDDIIDELASLRGRAVRILESDASWETKFCLIFSDDLILRVRYLDPQFSYYDPDTTYEDDTTAFVRAFQERVDDLQKAVQ